MFAKPNRDGAETLVLADTLPLSACEIVRWKRAVVIDKRSDAYRAKQVHCASGRRRAEHGVSAEPQFERPWKHGPHDLLAEDAHNANSNASGRILLQKWSSVTDPCQTAARSVFGVCAVEKNRRKRKNVVVRQLLQLQKQKNNIVVSARHRKTIARRRIYRILGILIVKTRRWLVLHTRDKVR
jgi:hypothetical protein